MICEGHLVCDDCHERVKLQDRIDRPITDAEKLLTERLVVDHLGCECEFEWSVDNGELLVKRVRAVEKIEFTIRIGESVEVTSC